MRSISVGSLDVFEVFHLLLYPYPHRVQSPNNVQASTSENRFGLVFHEGFPQELRWEPSLQASQEQVLINYLRVKTGRI